MHTLDLARDPGPFDMRGWLAERASGFDEIEPPARPIAPPMPQRVVKGVTLFHEGNRLRCFHKVLAGDFKLIRTEEDGYEQVLDFPGKGELLGLDALDTGVHGCSAIALCDASVLVLPATSVEELRRVCPDIDVDLRIALGRSHRRLADLAWMTAPTGADRRTARFLLHTARRMEARGQSPRRLRLPMRRRDIASHLGLAHESVTRALTAMAETGMLHVHLREIEIVDPVALEAFARSPRCYQDADAGGRSRTAAAFSRAVALA